MHAYACVLTMSSMHVLSLGLGYMHMLGCRPVERRAEVQLLQDDNHNYHHDHHQAEGIYF